MSIDRAGCSLTVGGVKLAGMLDRSDPWVLMREAAKGERMWLTCLGRLGQDPG